ncbi:MAG: class I SAM-dependent methyltransferase [Rickettsiales bacterium]|jgi:2-polyprenyl-3-methyl-5-hydroxy-6-metoxy-1,4-benzoquinol methylase|nr:class I SAM-dependent methyltransferase [Rickettsiales bacterium]
MKTIKNTLYPYLDAYSKNRGIAAVNAVKAYEIENEFHKKIMTEKSSENRKMLYANVYNAVHLLYGKSTNLHSHDKLVNLFGKELRGKSVLDVGCGEGQFLTSIARQLPHKKLVGIDTSIPHLPQDNNNLGIEFRLGDVIDFDLQEQFDVVFSNHVIEHIAPADMSTHLISVKKAMKSDGLFIINAPHRLFGPWDITCIKDNSHTNKIPAQGTHVNETTYSDIILILQENGFDNFKTIFPIPRIKDYLTNLRFSPSFLMFIENNVFLMNLLYASKIFGGERGCIARFDLTLICSKKRCID